MESASKLPSTRVVFFGTPLFAVPALDALVAARANIVGVVTQPEKPAGRGHGMRASAVARRTIELGLPLFTPKGLKKEENRKFLCDLRPDLLVVTAYGKILPKEVLDLPTHGAVNIHASLLPTYRGAAPILAAILAGNTETGVTIIKLDEGMDTGPILAQESVPIDPHDTTATLAGKLSAAGARVLVPTLERYLSGALFPTPQNHAQATSCPLLKKEDGRIDWKKPASEIARMIRAYEPWPRVYTIWKKKRLIIRNAAAREGTSATPGRAVRDAEGISVMTGSGSLLLEIVQIEDRKPLAVEVFVQGYPDFIGSTLGEETPPAVPDVREVRLRKRGSKGDRGSTRSPSPE